MQADLVELGEDQFASDVVISQDWEHCGELVREEVLLCAALRFSTLCNEKARFDISNARYIS